MVYPFRDSFLVMAGALIVSHDILVIIDLNCRNMVQKTYEKRCKQDMGISILQHPIVGGIPPHWVTCENADLRGRRCVKIIAFCARKRARRTMLWPVTLQSQMSQLYL